MAELKAYLNDSDGDLLLRNGQLVKGNCLGQEVGDVLMLNKGQVKNNPLCGPNLIRFVKGKTAAMGKEVKVALERDNKRVGRVTVDGGKIYPEVEY